MDMVIGVDPDADKNGIAIFLDSRLSELRCLTTIEFYFMLKGFIQDKKLSSILVSIEDVKSAKPTFKKADRRGGQSVINKISQNVGQCKHAQTEIERCCKELSVKIKHYPPASGFKKGFEVELFKKMTGYTGRSNADQRSAAYFGMLALRPSRRKS